MFERAIVGYVDILGYRDLVERAKGRPELVKSIEEAFYDISVAAVRELCELDIKDLANEPDKGMQDYFKRVVSTIRVRNNADSFIFSLPVSAINFRCKEYDERKTVGNCIHALFSSMPMFSLLHICKVGYLLRGGISIGDHYESERDGQLFIFSEAHNRAVTLESKKADTPRIILDEVLAEYLSEISTYLVNKFFYKDEDGYSCLDIYNGFDMFARKEVMLTDIKNAITLALEHNPGNQRVIDKLVYFARYHNKRVCGQHINLPHLLIQI